MSLLNKDQVALIEADINRARITVNHLQDELIDHVCCEVEQLMNDGFTFDNAYRQVAAYAGISVLLKIQENTLLLINKNYAIMKNTMKLSGNISLVLITAGTLMKMSGIPGAAIILVIGFALLCALFFPSAVFLNYNRDREKHLLRRVSLTAGGILMMAGILFKVMHWQGADIMLAAGWALLLCVFLPALIVSTLKQASSAKEKRVYLLGAAALVIFELATMFKFFHWPGASALLLTGSVLLIGGFLPAYTLIILKHRKQSTAVFIFLVILSVYAIAMTALMNTTTSGRGHSAPRDQTIEQEMYPKA